VRGPYQPVSPLWQIECACGHEGCEARHTIYTGRMPTWPSIVRRILKTNPKAQCGDHDLLWREDLLSGTEFAHKTPMR
jgi:hypothetical protein